MRYAFHFDESDLSWRSLDKTLFRSMLKDQPRCHVLIRRGGIRPPGDTKELRIQNASLLVDASSSTITAEQYVRIFEQCNVYAVVIQGLTRQHAEKTSMELANREAFLGMVGLHFGDPLHWAVYWTTLYQRYRIVGDELRLQHIALELGDEDPRDPEILEYWQKSALFAHVVWENLGVRTTILDEFDTYQQEQFVSETQHLMADLLENVANEVLLRAIDLDPRLVHGLHAALDRLSTAHTSEQMAQTALSCRRSLKLLADHLFPPTGETRRGRGLGPDKWKNRLWAYAQDALGSKGGAAMDIRLADIGKRIDAIADTASSTVHRTVIQQVAVTRLVVAWLSLIYDLVLLSPPPTELPEDAYIAGIKRTMINLLS